MLPVLLLLVAAALAACGGGSGNGSRAAGTTSTTAPTPVRRPDRAHPLLVTMTGDSVMLDNLAHGFAAALDTGGESIVSQVWFLSMTRDASAAVVLRQSIADIDPDLLVVSMGVWELDAVEDEMAEPGWRDRYRHDTVEPLIDDLTVDGAHVLWIGLPTWDNPPDGQRDLAILQSVYADVAADDERVDFLDARTLLDDPVGTFTEVLPDPDGGAPLTVRNPDGLHICPDGVRLVVSEALGWLTERWPVPVSSSWEDEQWFVGPDGEPRENFVGCPAP